MIDTQTVTVVTDINLSVHGSQWVADIPVRTGTVTSQCLRLAQGTCMPLSISETLQWPSVIIVLADIDGDVETWRAFKVEAR